MKLICQRCKKCVVLLLLIVLAFININAQSKIGSWGDQGNGTYINPVLYADYSDPDVIRVNDKYYMVCSEFHYMGMPVLESEDMVNWKIIAQIYSRLDFPIYDQMNGYSKGSWAPAIRYYSGKFWVYFCTPTEGLFMSTAEQPDGPWSPLLQVKNVEMWEDPCPFWDDDGSAYLIHSLHGAGPIIIHKMSVDGTHLLDDGKIIYTGFIAEGPKMFKREGYYYISIPEGGVATGWQTILRSKNIYGPYEKKVVLEKGRTCVNGPHQGAFVDTPDGEWWFYHFQSVDPIGRVVHLQPVFWQEGWPFVGVDLDRNGIGEPVYVWKKPAINKTTLICAPQTDDDFNKPQLGLQWQFNHNQFESAWSLTENRGFLSLKSLKGDCFLRAKNTITQKIMGMEGEAVVELNLSLIANGQKAGLCILGGPLYNLVGIYRENNQNYLFFESNEDLFAQTMQRKRIDYFDTSKNYIEKQPIISDVLYLKVKLDLHVNANQFFYSFDNENFVPYGRSFRTMSGFWKGSRIGIYSYNIQGSSGGALFNWCRYDYDGPKFVND
jgi:beta-xylosidase